MNKQKSIKKKIDPEKKKKNKRKAAIQQILKNIKPQNNIANNKKKMISTICTPYLTSLLYPEICTQAKIPGMADQTVSLHRKVTIMSTANALGAIGIIAQPTFLSDTTSSCIAIQNAAGYDGITASGNATVVACPFGIPTNTISTYRLVSFSVVVTPQLSNLNLQGTLHGALIKTDGDTPRAPGTLSSIVGIAVPNISNNPTYCEVNVNTGNGLRIVWCPNNLSLLDFKQINQNWQTFESSMNEFVPMIVGVGLPANAPIRIDLFFNFEVTPLISNSNISILSGMESICPHNETPSTVWRDFFTTHSTKIATPYLGHNHDYNLVRLSNTNMIDSSKSEQKGVFQDRIYQMMNNKSVLY
jgi:hypothetical protein